MIPEDGLARAMDNAQLTPLRKRNPKTSRRLAAAIEKAMAIDPADRYQIAEDFKKALLGSKSKTEQVTGNYTVVPAPDIPETPPASKEEPPDQPPRQPTGPVPPPAVEEEKPFVPPKKRRRSNAGCILFLLLLILALAGGVYFFPNFVPDNVRQAIPFPLPSWRPAASATPTATASMTAAPPVQSSTATAAPPTATFTFTPTSLPSNVETGTPISANSVTLTPEVPTGSPTPSPTPIGGGSGQIAFASDRSGIPQIYLSDLAAINVQPITNMPEGACQPSWSPDGTKLVFVSPCHGRLDIADSPPKDTALYTINADGTDLTPLPTVPGGDFEPAWSPDGKHIAFTSLRDGHMQIYSLDMSDLTVTRLTNTPADVETREPAWSPFSNQIAYAAKRFGAYQIWTMTDTGQGQQQIVRSGQQYWDYLPVWSTDGKMILFNERDAGGPSQAWMMSIIYEERDTAQPTQLALGSLPVLDVHFAPDGFWLAAVGQSENENWDIFYMTVSGAQRTRLTKDPGVDFDPAWRPKPNP